MCHCRVGSLAGCQDGLTPLHIACNVKNKRAIKVLLEGGAAVNAVSDADGTTPLHLACAVGSRASAILLIGAHANINAVSLVGGWGMCARGWVGFLPSLVGLLAGWAR